MNTFDIYEIYYIFLHALYHVVMECGKIGLFCLSSSFYVACANTSIGVKGEAISLSIKI